MGWKPADVYGCTVPEFYWAWDGWLAANSAPKVEPMNRGELEALLRQAEAKEDGRRA